MSSGIYKWTNKETGSVYVGQAIDLERRMKEFLRFDTQYAGRLINEERKKYNSLTYWDYCILEKCEPQQLDKLEEKYIKENKNAKILNIAKIPTKKKKDIIKKIIIEKPHLCPLSYTYKLNKLINNILKSDNTQKSDYGLKNDLNKIIKLIHDKRIKVIKKHTSENEGFLYNELTLEINKNICKEYFNYSKNTLLLWSLFNNFKCLLDINNKYISFNEEDLPISHYIGGCNCSMEFEKHFTINETFYNLTKQYAKTN